MGVTMRDAERDAFETIEAESRLHDMPEEAAIVNDNMNAEERDILDRFERGELRSAPSVEREIDAARRAARNTFNKTGESICGLPSATSISPTRAPGKRECPTRRCCPASSTSTCPVGWPRRDSPTTRHGPYQLHATSTSRSRSARWRRYGPTSWPWSGRRRGWSEIVAQVVIEEKHEDDGNTQESLL